MSGLEESKDWEDDDDTVLPSPPLSSTQPNSAAFRIPDEIQKKDRKRNKSASPPPPPLKRSDATHSLRDRTKKPKVTNYAVLIDGERQVCTVYLLDKAHFPDDDPTLDSLEQRQKWSIGDDVGFHWPDDQSNKVWRGRVAGMCSSKAEADKIALDVENDLINESIDHKNRLFKITSENDNTDPMGQEMQRRISLEMQRGIVTPVVERRKQLMSPSMSTPSTTSDKSDEPQTKRKKPEQLKTTRPSIPAAYVMSDEPSMSQSTGQMNQRSTSQQPITPMAKKVFPAAAVVKTSMAAAVPTKTTPTRLNTRREALNNNSKPTSSKTIAAHKLSLGKPLPAMFNPSPHIQSKQNLLGAVSSKRHITKLPRTETAVFDKTSMTSKKPQAKRVQRPWSSVSDSEDVLDSAKKVTVAVEHLDEYSPSPEDEQQQWEDKEWNEMATLVAAQEQERRRKQLLEATKISIKRAKSKAGRAENKKRRPSSSTDTSYRVDDGDESDDSHATSSERSTPVTKAQCPSTAPKRPNVAPNVEVDNGGVQVVAQVGEVEFATREDIKTLTNMLKTVLDKLAKVSNDQKAMRRSMAKKGKGKIGQQNITLDSIEQENDLSFLFDHEQESLTYRGVDITDEINNLFTKNSTNSSRFCIAFIRYLWGDRNMWFWQVRYERLDARPEDMNDDDQTTDGVRGREKVMNMKDPEGVALFKVILKRYWEKYLWPSFDRTAEFDNNSELDDNIRRKEKAKQGIAKKSALVRHLEQMCLCASQWGNDAHQRKNRSDDSLYWRLLDQKLKPCPNWKLDWEIIDDEKVVELKDKYKRRRVEREELSETLRAVRRLDHYYDVPLDDEESGEDDVQENVNIQ